jgi:putative restriction endonuclease
MEYFIGNTDFEWFNFLRNKNPEDINFWQPGGKLRFHAIKPGAPFLFRLKSPINKISGIGFFSSHSLLPIDFAWEVFQQRNGVDSLDKFRNKINDYRTSDNSLNIYPTIGCLILANPVFFNESDWLPSPSDWQKNLVQGKKYDSTIGNGKDLWDKIEFLLHKYRLFDHQKEYQNQFVVEEEKLGNRYGSEILTRVRLGQARTVAFINFPMNGDKLSTRIQKNMTFLICIKLTKPWFAGLISFDNF